MYYFVEYMRARRAMRVVAIILGVLIVAAVGLRLYFLSYSTPETLAVALERSPSAHVTQTRLPDGTRESVVDDPQKRVHAVIDRKPRELRITLTEPSAMYSSQSKRTFSMGSNSEHVEDTNGIARVKLDYRQDADFDLSVLFIISIATGLLTATMLAAPLAKENDGHLELTWTKPVSRSAYALASIGVDIAAIVASQILTVAAILACATIFVLPNMGFGSILYMGLALLGPITWYALLTTISASVKRGPGLVIGMGWLGAVFIGGIAKGTAHMTDSALGNAVHQVTQAIAYFDPIAYLSFGDGGVVPNGVIHGVGETLAVLGVLAVLYIVSAVLQWRRVEA